MPSRWRASSMLRADENAMRASRAKSSHEERMVLSMFDCVDGWRNERKRKWV